MSLVIFISSKSVIISKYRVEIPFKAPPRNLTKAAIGAYQLLRQSEIIQSSSTRNEREEAMTLLRHYGYALLESIVPDPHKSRVYQTGGIFIYSLDREIMKLPWELLYDGTSFLAQTQGVVRINNTPKRVLIPNSKEESPYLKVALNSFIPLQSKSPGKRFISHVEELASGSLRLSPHVKISFNSNSAQSSIIQSLADQPDLFFFSGYDTEKEWLLDEKDKPAENELWFHQELKPAITHAVSTGLRILVLHTSSLLRDFNYVGKDPLNQYFELGLPYIISINGRIARARLREYFQNLITSLAREDNILRAHRHAINSIQASLPLSWDWSWIQLNLNKNLLEQESEEPLASFNINREAVDSPAKINQTEPNYISHFRRFSGSSEVLNSVIKNLESSPQNEILCLRSVKGLMMEQYLQEYFRRLSSQREFALSILYYHRWGFEKEQPRKLAKTRFSKYFAFLLNNKFISSYFETCLIDISKKEWKGAKEKYLIVYFPPEIIDTAFDTWIKEKQKEGVKVIFLSDHSGNTRLTRSVISTDKLCVSEINESFEDELPEQWFDVLSDPLPSQMQNLTLLKIVQRFGDPKLIDWFKQEHSENVLWERSLTTVLGALSNQALKIIMTLYLLRTKCSKTYLAELLSEKNINTELAELRNLHLIDSDLTSEFFWIPISLYLQISKFELMPKSKLVVFGKEISQRQTAIFNRDRIPKPYQIAGFQYCTHELIKYEPVESQLQRNLQFGRKLSSFAKGTPELLFSNINTSLEIALIPNKMKLVQDTLYAVLKIMENLPLDNETLQIYRWLLKHEEKARNWTQVSEIMVKLAGLYAKLNHKEKAVGLLTSAIQLNDDIKNYSSKFQNLITIALLLLDLEEIEKARKLINNTDFDIELLNSSDVEKLWLIDGHLLFHDNKLAEAGKSFSRVLKFKQLPVSDSLMAKTFLNMAEIHFSANQTDAYGKCLTRASSFFESAGNYEFAFELHQKTSDYLLASGKIEAAIIHLEWLFHSFKQSGELHQAKDIADQLGGLYFKVGNHNKSTDYYSISQGMISS